MRDDCAMTMVLCPYEGAGCTFLVSSVMIERFDNHFVVATSFPERLFVVAV